MRIFCSICKDIYIPYSEVHVTSCGHLYHGSCISTWLKQHKTCPQCRTNLSKPFRVYFDVDKDNDADPSTLEHQIETLSDKLREAERVKAKLLEENQSCEKILEGMKECAVSLSKQNDVLKTSVKTLKEQVIKLSKKNEAVTQLENEIETLRTKLSNLTRIETIIKGSAEEVNKMIESTPVSGLAVKHLCTYVGILKSQLQKIEAKNISLVKENRNFAKTLAEEKRDIISKTDEVFNNLRERYVKLESELMQLKSKLRKETKEKPLKENEETASSVRTNSAQIKKNKFFDIDLDSFDDDKKNTTKLNDSSETEKTINNWEELVCAGPSRSFGLSLVKQSKSFNKTLYHNKEDKDVSSSNTTYAFDGFGGRKKLRLAGPTPAEEFEKIKKKKEKKAMPTFHHKKIIEYYQLS